MSHAPYDETEQPAVVFTSDRRQGDAARCEQMRARVVLVLLVQNCFGASGTNEGCWGKR